jgi:hypothetical protein
LKPEETAAVGREVLAAMRPVQLVVASGLEQDIPGERIAGPDGETAVKQLFLRIDARRVPEGRPEPVVAVLTGAPYGSQSRLAYGEMRNGRFELLWDSPLFGGWRLRIGYNDVDNDGTEEILLFSESGRPPDTFNLLSILDRNGRELTRQRNCYQDEPTWEEGALCPVVGGEMELVPSSDGRTKDIEVKGSWVPGNWDEREYRYHLEGGRYVGRPASGPAKRRVRGPS